MEELGPVEPQVDWGSPTEEEPPARLPSSRPMPFEGKQLVSPPLPLGNWFLDKCQVPLPLALWLKKLMHDVGTFSQSHSSRV